MTMLAGPAAVLTVLLASATEAWLLLRFWKDADEFTRLLALHGAITTGTAITAFGLRRHAGREPVFLVFVISVVFLGPIGVAGACLSALMHRAFAWRARPFAEWYASLFPEEPQDRVRALHDRVVHRGHGPRARVTVAPFGDVMALGTLQEKQAAIGLIAACFEPAFAPALRAALNDAEAAIRVQAASAVARIEQRFLQQSMVIGQRLAALPDDPAILIEAARHQEAMASAGLLDEGRARQAAEEAVQMYRHLLSLPDAGPWMEDAVAGAARMLLLLGEAEKAARLLAPATTRTDASATLVGLHLEALFRLHRFVELREFCLHLDAAREARLPKPLREALRMWRSDGADLPMLAAAP